MAEQADMFGLFDQQDETALEEAALQVSPVLEDDEAAAAVEDFDDEPAEPDEPPIWTDYRCHWQNGAVMVEASTNDADDRGHPSRHDAWQLGPFETPEAAFKITGKTRVGVSGMRVTVTFEGNQVDDEFMAQMSGRV
jgi:hypothetical protein